MVTIGIFARIDPAKSSAVQKALANLPQLEVLGLEQPDTLGVVLTAADAESAHDILRTQIETLPGVLCAWPIHTELHERA